MKNAVLCTVNIRSVTWLWLQITIVASQVTSLVADKKLLVELEYIPLRRPQGNLIVIWDSFFSSKVKHGPLNMKVYDGKCRQASQPICIFCL